MPRLNRTVERITERGSLVDLGPHVRERAPELRRGRLLADHAIIPLYFYVSKHLVKPYIKGYQNNILDHTYSKDLWIEAP